MSNSHQSFGKNTKASTLSYQLPMKKELLIAPLLFQPKYKEQSHPLRKY